MDVTMIMQAVRTYAVRADFPADAIQSLTMAAEKLPDGALAFLMEVGAKYRAGEKLTLSMQEEFENLATPLHSYEAQMLYYMALLPVLEEKYRQKKLSAVLFARVLFDLRAKLLECQAVYGIWGSFVAIWFARFFNFTLYGIGRLEFAPFHAEYDYEGQGRTLKKGDAVLDVHIPSGAPLPHAEVMRSYRMAAEFFDCDVFVCESWLLWPDNKTLLKNCPNLMAFWQDYEIVQSQPDNGDLWRIFGADHEKSPNLLPRDTVLRRVYAERLEKGLPVGWGKGVYILK